jgi:L-fucose isomerase-like protein
MEKVTMQTKSSVESTPERTGDLSPVNEHHSKSPRVGFLVIGRKRKGFDMDWGREIEAAVWAVSESLPLTPVRPPTRVVDDATLRAALGELQQAACDTIVVLQPIMGDGRLAPILTQLWRAPIVLWATPERQDSGTVSSCSLVGAHVFASMFRQLGQPFEIVYGHPGDDQLKEQLIRAVRLCAGATHLRRAKVGLVGSHAPGFINMHADPMALSNQLGVQLHHVGLQEFFDLIDGQDTEAVTSDVARVCQIGLPEDDGIGDDDLAANSRYYLAMCALLENENLDALAVRCWPELPNRFGHWPYLAMARLAGQSVPVALEGDVDGALTCLIGRLSGIGVGYISDWLEHETHAITLWHPGHAPFDFCQPETLRLGRHFNSGHPLVVNATLAADRPITLARLWRCDGGYRLTACEAETAPPRRPLTGAHGLAYIKDLNVCDWFDELCHQGMPHHITVFQGHHRELLRRWARLLAVEWV